MKCERTLPLLILLIALLGFQDLIFAGNPYRDHRYSSYKTLPACEEGDILFVGNSITNMMNWWEAFGSRANIRGRGNSGTISKELLEYFDDIVKGKPSKVFLMIGTNDLGNDLEVNRPDSVAARIIEFMEKTEAKVPGVEIYYQSILPSLIAKRTKEKIEATNTLVKQWIEGQNNPKIVYIDLFTPMATEDGNISTTHAAPDPETLSFDNLHLTQKGYKIWLDIIKDYVGFEPMFGENAVNLDGGMGGSNAMRVSYFGALPLKSSDILLIGDEMIHNGEWQERLHNTNIKDRGIGWGFPGIPLATQEGAFDAILSGNMENGVMKETPRAVALYGGTGEVQRGWGADSLFLAYSHAISELRKRLPDTPIFAMTLLPFPASETEKNKVIAEFNKRVVGELVKPELNIQLIDLYHTGGGPQRIESYFMSEESPFINGEGYNAVAKAIGEAIDSLESLSDYSIIPKPQSAIFKNGKVVPGNIKVETPFWSDRIPDILDSLRLSDDKDSFLLKCEIDCDISYGGSQSDEAYRLTVTDHSISIKAPTPKGIYWGLVTLNQLVKKNEKNESSLPLCEITDWPAFSIRGFMLDTGRTFISLEELKEEIDVMSRLKMNTFHWHFTENQGWRLESKIFPQLNDSANMLRDYGKFYKIEEAKDLVKFAAQRNILVIPEIDMPGHSKAFENTFGFDMQSPEGIETLKKLLGEAFETFADLPYFHIGTDEVTFTNPDFVPEMVKWVRDHGKMVLSWNPGWNYKPGEIDMLQLWSYRGKPIEGIPAIDSRFHYINHFDTYADIRALYRSNIYGRAKEDNSIKGLILALWNDRYITDENSISTQNNLYPLLMATAERGWDGGGTEYFDSLGTNMGTPESADFRNFTDFERRLLHKKSTYLKHKNIPYVRQSNVNWLITEAFPNNGDLTAVFPPETLGPKYQYLYNDSLYNSRAARGAGIYLRHVWGNTIPSFYDNPLPDHTAYAFTNVYSPVDQEVGLQFETQNYSRSEPDLPPPPGKWDYRESRLWINGKEITPREWDNKHKEKNNEIPLRNENMAPDNPIPVELHKGWNNVMIKLPVGDFSTPEVRLAKWMFSFVFTTPDGKNAAPDLIYVPILSENEI